MDFTLIWKTILIFIFGTIILKLCGRKTIAEMTFPQAVIMLALGTLLIQPITSEGIWTTFIISFIFILCLIITEYIELKFDKAETSISGKSIPVIENGMIITKNLTKLRLTVDMLETRIRQSGISAITDVQFATIETNGQLGYMLKEEKQPATKEDIQTLIQLIQTGNLNHPITNASVQDNLFIETLHTVPTESPQQEQ